MMLNAKYISCNATMSKPWSRSTILLMLVHTLTIVPKFVRM